MSRTPPGCGKGADVSGARSRRSAHESTSTASSPVAGTSARSRGASRRCSAIPCCPSRSGRTTSSRAASSTPASCRRPSPSTRNAPSRPDRRLAQAPHRRRGHPRHVHRQHADEARRAQQRVDAGEQPGHRSAARRVLDHEGHRPRGPHGVRSDDHDLVGVEERVDGVLQQRPAGQLDGRLVDPVHPRGRAAGEDHAAEAAGGEVEVHAGILAAALVPDRSRRVAALRWWHGLHPTADRPAARARPPVGERARPRRQPRPPRRGGAAGADLVVLPEAFARDFGQAGSDVSPFAEPVDGPFAREVAARGRRDLVHRGGRDVRGRRRPRPALQHPRRRRSQPGDVPQDPPLRLLRLPRVRPPDRRPGRAGGRRRRRAGRSG